MVLNPSAVDERKATVDPVRRRRLAASWDTVHVRHTAPEDARPSAVCAAVAQGAGVVPRCGTDGTLVAAAASPALHSLRATRVDTCSRSVDEPQFDGGVMAPDCSRAVGIEPAALVVKVAG